MKKLEKLPYYKFCSLLFCLVVTELIAIMLLQSSVLQPLLCFWIIILFHREPISRIILLITVISMISLIISGYGIEIAFFLLFFSIMLHYFGSIFNNNAVATYALWLCILLISKEIVFYNPYIPLSIKIPYTFMTIFVNLWVIVFLFRITYQR